MEIKPGASRFCVGTAAPGCPVERSSTALLRSFKGALKRRSFAPQDSRARLSLHSSRREVN